MEPTKEESVPTTHSEGSERSLEGHKPREAEHLEIVRTISRVPGNDHYYEKDGLRTYGDDEDHDHEPPVRL